ncbi:MAG: ribonuclease HI family protein [Deltaproteobacteria bacterium]|nr:ribonuclease HI family protein [Deltaproteobacteria bacterium]
MPGRRQSDAAASLRDAADRRSFPKTLKRFRIIDDATLRAILRSVAEDLEAHTDVRVASATRSPRASRLAPPASPSHASRLAPHASAIVRIDGASRGNPGPAAAAAIIETADGREIARACEPLGVTTNNQAEYRALILGLGKALELGITGVEVLSDSELLVRQMNGQYRVKNAEIRDLKAMAEELASRLRAAEFHHVPREENAEADRLANDVLDGRA